MQSEIDALEQTVANFPPDVDTGGGAGWTTVVTAVAFNATSYQVVEADATNGPFTVTVPVDEGAVSVVKKTDASVNIVTVIGAAGLMDGWAVNAELVQQGSSAIFIGDGQQPMIAASYPNVGGGGTGGGAGWPDPVDWTGTSHTADDAVTSGVWRITSAQCPIPYYSANSNPNYGTTMGFLRVYEITDNSGSGGSPASNIAQQWQPADASWYGELWVRAGWSSGGTVLWDFWRPAHFVPTNAVNDFNLIDLSGTYLATGNSTNGPGSVNSGVLVAHIANDSSSSYGDLPTVSCQTQTWTDMTTGDIWVRNATGVEPAVWLPWKKITTT